MTKIQNSTIYIQKSFSIFKTHLYSKSDFVKERKERKKNFSDNSKLFYRKKEIIGFYILFAVVVIIVVVIKCGPKTI